MSERQTVIMSCCPFDKTHVVEARKLAKHIEKCKSPKRMDYQQCKFNPSHWYLTKDVNRHLQHCENYVEKGKEKIGVKSHSESMSHNESISVILPLEEEVDEDETIIYLAKNDIITSKRTDHSKKESSFYSEKKKLFQQFKKVEESGLWKPPSFVQYCKEWKEKKGKKDKNTGINRVIRSNHDQSF